jgi:hypothetical protein
VGSFPESFRKVSEKREIWEASILPGKNGKFPGNMQNITENSENR